MVLQHKTHHHQRTIIPAPAKKRSRKNSWKRCQMLNIGIADNGNVIIHQFKGDIEDENVNGKT